MVLLLLFFRWLGVLMEIIGALCVFFAALFAVLNRDSISSGLAALSVTYALQVDDLIFH